MNYELITLAVNIISLVFVFITGCFALHQWRKGLVYKRAEVVRDLIGTIRDDKVTAAIIDLVDWDEGFVYNGKFQIISDIARRDIKDLSDDELFKMIDKTLAKFTYICYLQQQHIIAKSDMMLFEYGIRRIADNKHISNYLYSLYHWSKSLDTPMSFSCLVQYCLKKGYLDKSFQEYRAGGNYTCFLQVNDKKRDTEWNRII